MSDIGLILTMLYILLLLPILLLLLRSRRKPQSAARKGRKGANGKGRRQEDGRSIAESRRGVHPGGVGWLGIGGKGEGVDG